MAVLWNEMRPGIYIDDDCGASFKFQTMRALDTINAKPIGADLLKILSQRHQGIGVKTRGLRVVITLGHGTLGRDTGHAGMPRVGATPSLDLTAALPQGDLGTAVRAPAAPGSLIRLPGSGLGAMVRYNPNVEHQYNTIGVNTPPFIALAHELIHAMHVMSGDLKKAYDWDNGTPGSSNGAILEEARTVGLGRYADTRISENAIRREHNLALRTFYGTLGDCNNLRV